MPGCVVPQPIPTDCGVNEQYETHPVGKCTPADQTCDMYFKGVLRDCEFGVFGEPGCRCRPAYVRNSQGVCVLPQDCEHRCPICCLISSHWRWGPGRGSIAGIAGKIIDDRSCYVSGCGKNSRFVTGYNLSGGTCANPEVRICHDLWQPFGCQCDPGFVKISDSDPTCVPQCDCVNYY